MIIQSSPSCTWERVTTHSKQLLLVSVRQELFVACKYSSSYHHYIDIYAERSADNPDGESIVLQYRAFLIYALIASLHVFSYHTYWVESKRGVECQQSEPLMLCESCILSTLHYLSVVTK